MYELLKKLKLIITHKFIIMDNFEYPALW